MYRGTGDVVAKRISNPLQQMLRPLLIEWRQARQPDCRQSFGLRFYKLLTGIKDHFLQHTVSTQRSSPDAALSAWPEQFSSSTGCHNHLTPSSGIIHNSGHGMTTLIHNTINFPQWHLCQPNRNLREGTVPEDKDVQSELA